MKIKSLLFVLLFSFCATAFSQSISNVDYEVKDENIVITYDLNGEPNTKYQIEVNFVNIDGTRVIPKTMDGDVGVVTGGKDKQIHWSVTFDTDGLDGKYKVVLTIKDKMKTTIKDKIKTQHAILFNANVPITIAGIRYAYLGKIGAYISLTNDFNLIYTEGVLIGTAGINVRIADKFYPYVGGGVDIYFGDPFIEGGIMYRHDRLIFDLGIGFNLFYYYPDNLFPLAYAKVGLGYCF